MRYSKKHGHYSRRINVKKAGKGPVRWEGILPILPHKEVTKVKRGKKYIEKAKLIDKTMLYDTADAIDLVQKTDV